MQAYIARGEAEEARLAAKAETERNIQAAQAAAAGAVEAMKKSQQSAGTQATSAVPVPNGYPGTRVLRRPISPYSQTLVREHHHLRPHRSAAPAAP